MGFVLKSAFWLGIVYWAMPFEPFPAPDVGTGSLCSADTLALSDQLKAVPETYRKLVLAGCMALSTARLESALARPNNAAARPAALAQTTASVSIGNKEPGTPRLAGPREPLPPRRPNKG